MGFAVDLHIAFAVLSTAAMLAVVAEGAWRARRRAPPGPWSARVATTTLMFVGMAAAGGLAMYVGGGRPREPIHYMYAGFAFATIPVADSLALRSSFRKRGIARLVGGMFGLVFMLRLLRTG